MSRPIILVVDDNPDYIKLVSDILNEEGYGVITALDGKTALELFKEKKPDLVILDIVMPGEYNGLDVLYYIRESSDVPIIMLTAYTHTASIRKSLEDGADDYITKPFSSQVLVARIHAKLRRTANKDTI